MSNEVVAQLVFIHIEKAAGTSQRALLDKVYGRDQVYWRGRDFKSRRERVHPDVTSRLVVGGHFSASNFYRARHPILFLSIVREPVSRAVSLFHYFSENGPDKDRKDWQDKGLLPSSMKRTIETVPEFREAVSNRQCFRLSGTSNFDSALDALHSRNFIVGSFDFLQAFTQRLASLLTWPAVTVGAHNQARRPSYQEEIVKEAGLVDLIRSLNAEDEQLYRSVASRKCFEHLPNAAIFQQHLAGDVATTSSRSSSRTG